MDSVLPLPLTDRRFSRKRFPQSFLTSCVDASRMPRAWFVRSIEGSGSQVPTSAFLVLIGFVDHETSDVLGQFTQALVIVIPFGARLVEEHNSLMGPAQLYESSL